MISAGGISAGIAAIGAGITGAAGFAGFLSAAGTILSTVGAIGGNKKLQKVGALIGLGGGLMGGMSANAAAANAASSSQGAAAASGIGDASSAWDAAGSAAGSDAGMLARYGNLGQSAGSIAETLQAGEAMSPSLGAIGNAAGSEAFAGADFIGDTGMPQPSIYEKLSTSQGQAAAPAVAPASAATQYTTVAPSPGLNLDPMSARAGQSTLDELLKKAGSGFDKLPAWIKQNKELMQLGGQMLYGMYGPQAEALDEQKSIMARRLANLNSPVRLGMRQPALAGMGG